MKRRDISIASSFSHFLSFYLAENISDVRRSLVSLLEGKCTVSGIAYGDWHRQLAVDGASASNSTRSMSEEAQITSLRFVGSLDDWTKQPLIGYFMIHLLWISRRGYRLIHPQEVSRPSERKILKYTFRTWSGSESFPDNFYLF